MGLTSRAEGLIVTNESDDEFRIRRIENEFLEFKIGCSTWWCDKSEIKDLVRLITNMAEDE